MFNKGKITRSFLTATNAFLTEMLRAILKEMTGSEVYLTQVSFKAQKPRKPQSHELADQQFINSVLEVEVSAFFTAIDTPRPRGREGYLPILPTAIATFKLTNEANGWYSWKLISSRVKVENCHTTCLQDESCWSFLGHNDWFTPASQNLCKLAEELQYRGPSRMSEDQ